MVITNESLQAMLHFAWNFILIFGSAFMLIIQYIKLRLARRYAESSFDKYIRFIRGTQFRSHKIIRITGADRVILIKYKRKANTSSVIWEVASANVEPLSEMYDDEPVGPWYDLDIDRMLEESEYLVTPDELACKWLGDIYRKNGVNHVLFGLLYQLELKDETLVYFVTVQFTNEPDLNDKMSDVREQLAHIRKLVQLKKEIQPTIERVIREI